MEPPVRQVGDFKLMIEANWLSVHATPCDGKLFQAKAVFADFFGFAGARGTDCRRIAYQKKESSWLRDDIRQRKAA
jgi:hypothetical protein